MSEKNIEQLLSVATESRSKDAYIQLFSALKGIELFFNVVNQGNKADGAKSQVEIPLASVGESLKAVVFYTSRQNPSLQKPFGGIRWEQALEMVRDMPAADGLVIQGITPDAWAAINKEMISTIIDSVAPSASKE